MKVFENKSIFKKLIIVLLCILLFSFCVPKTVSADAGEIGGKLLNPVMSLFVSLGDGAITLLQKVVFHSDQSLINIDTSADFWSKFIVIVAAALLVAVAIVAVVYTGGGAITVALGVIKVTLTASVVTIITFPITTSVVESMLPDSFYLPLYSITPQEIFSNKIPLLDVDFFNPSESITVSKQEIVKNEVKALDEKMKDLEENHGFKSLDKCNKKIQKLDNGENLSIYSWEYADKKYKLVKTEWQTNDAIGWNCFYTKNAETEQHFVFGDTSSYVYESDMETKTTTNTVGTEEMKSTSAELQSTISNWYTILRDISLVALLSVLVYIGIRILISSTSNDKAKYKQMLIDWIVAICLLFVIHYIMSFSNILVKKFIDLVDVTAIASNENTEVIEPEMYEFTSKDFVDKAYETLVSKPAENGDIASEEESPYYKYFVDENGDKTGKFLWPAENFMQQARINAQFLEDDKDTYIAIGWKLIYVVLVVFTFIFVFTYLKRVVYMAFLTLIAPLVALTYPIDKINDGKAQAFNIWFKEYIFNLLIQPMHLILYTILISSAMDFASKNILYVVVSLGFMIPAEKLLRKFFGFEKATTPGLLAGPAGAAIMMNGINKLLGKGSKGGKSANNAKKLENGQDDEKPPYINSSFDKQNAMIGEEDSEYQNGILEDVNNSEINMETFSERQDPSLEDPNYMYMHPDEYDENLEWLGPRQVGGEESNEESQQTEPVHINEEMNQHQELGSEVPRRSIRRAIGSTARYYARGTARQLGNNIKNYHPLRNSLKFASGLAGATTIGALGGIAGIASGDPSKAVQYMAAGTIGGYKLSSEIPSKMALSAPEGIGEVARSSYFGSDEQYNKYKQEQYKRDYKMNEKNMLKLEQRYSPKDAKEIMKNVVPKCLDNGISDMDDIITINEMVRTGAVKDINMGISTAKYASRIGQDTTKMKKKDRDDWNKTFASEFAKNQRVRQNNMDSNKIADSVLSRVDAFYKIKNS